MGRKESKQAKTFFYIFLVRAAKNIYVYLGQHYKSSVSTSVDVFFLLFTSQSIAMVITGRSIHLNTLLPGQA